MKKRITLYVNYIDQILAENSIESNRESNAKRESQMDIGTKSGQVTDYEELCREHLLQISFFQHERLIHLMVLITFAILTFGTFFLLYLSFHFMLVLLFLAFLVLLVPYILHYYLLENSVQKMYEQYDALCKKANKKGFSVEDSSSGR